MCAMMHGSSVFETVTTGISGHSAQDEPTAATIAKRFSALAVAFVFTVFLLIAGAAVEKWLQGRRLVSDEQ